MRTLRPLLLLAILLAIAAAAYYGGAAAALSWPAVGSKLNGWRALIATRPAAVALAYVGVYAGCVALSLPVGEVLTALGGALFGAVAGGALAVVAATCGAVLLFALVRSLPGRWFAAGTETLVARLRPALERDGFSALLALRLIPLVPFWLANLAPILLGMRLFPYAAATLLGIAPASFIVASVGAGAEAVLARGHAPDFSSMLSARVLLPLLALAALAAAPALWRHWRARHA